MMVPVSRLDHFDRGILGGRLREGSGQVLEKAFHVFVPAATRDP